MSARSETPFRLYTVDRQGEPSCLTAYDAASVGDGLLYWHGRGATITGVMYRPFDDQPGTWIVNPWEPAVASGRLSSATTEGGADE